MDDRHVTKIEAVFNVGTQTTNLSVNELEDATYEVHGWSLQSSIERLQGKKTVTCAGKFFQVDVEALAERLGVLYRDAWFHHYWQANDGWYECWNSAMSITWSLKLQYASGGVDRWEGCNDGPKNLTDLYRLMVLYGMPELDRSVVSRLDDLGLVTKEWKDLGRLSQYLVWLKAAYEDPSDEGKDLLEREFLEDIRLYLSGQELGVSADEILSTWGIDARAESLSAVDVSHAPRAKMYALFWKLGQPDTPHTVLQAMIEGDVLRRWFDRMSAIPREEAEERDHERETERKRLMDSLIEEIQRRVESGQVFTSRDVANSVGVTGQQASAYLRSFVKQGKLRVVGSEYPRKYRAA